MFSLRGMRWSANITTWLTGISAKLGYNNTMHVSHPQVLGTASNAAGQNLLHYKQSLTSSNIPSVSPAGVFNAKRVKSFTTELSGPVTASCVLPALLVCCSTREEGSAAAAITAVPCEVDITACVVAGGCADLFPALSTGTVDSCLAEHAPSVPCNNMHAICIRAHESSPITPAFCGDNG